MKQKPIIFSTPMVQAILAGKKTQTRRIVKGFALHCLQMGFNADYVLDPSNSKLHRYGSKGDELWVRETFFPWETGGYAYKADGFIQRYGAWERDTPKKFHDVERIEKWKPSIHMPKTACRIFLENTEVRIERLQDISEEDAIAEGILPEPTGDNLFKNYGKNGYRFIKTKDSYKSLWQSINGPGSWDKNPFVWVITFKRKQQ